ncbi:hypothetical protein Lal_00003350 [Lupinus albus]|nr:hypothetical protein Lal_00003350 [Lupinus albus]
MGSNNGNFTTTLPLLNGKNWSKWKIQMDSILGFQDLGNLIEDGLQELPENPTEIQKLDFKESKKKDHKVKFLLHQCVDEAHFEKIAGVATSQEAWRILEKCSEGAEQLKKVNS